MSTEAIAPEPAAPPAPATPPPPVATPTAPSNNGQPFHADWMKSDGSLNPSAYERLPDDIRYMKDTLSKYKTAEELVRGMAYAQTFAGKKGLLPLPENAPSEVRAERKSVLDSINGVPKEPKDYGIARPEGLKEEHWNQPLADSFAKWAHENSVSPAAVKKLISVQLDAVKGQLANQEAYVQKFYDDHAKAFDSAIRAENIPADRATALAERGAIALGVDLKNPEQAALLKNSTVKLAMMRHALATGEDTYVAGESGKGAEGDPMALAQDATHNKANPLYEPLHNSGHPQHRMAKEKVDGYWRAAAAKAQKR